MSADRRKSYLEYLSVHKSRFDSLRALKKLPDRPDLRALEAEVDSLTQVFTHGNGYPRDHERIKIVHNKCSSYFKRIVAATSKGGQPSSSSGTSKGVHSFLSEFVSGESTVRFAAIHPPTQCICTL
jgi:hypothetical protein